MAIEEAIKKFEAWAECKYEPTRQAALMAISALRAQETKLDRSRWEGCTHCDDGCCCTCKYSVTRPTFSPCRECDIGSMYDPQNYCPNCGRPLTEEAWAEMERRIST